MRPSGTAWKEILIAKAPQFSQAKSANKSPVKNAPLLITAL
ncbi:hypothetical protein BSPWISOXPB_4383 [uncultured Gammaproteobacteria bacterium]|nr:hypothetical protein BSPWISOXPB_4383 [uncultured Gammaproteobacteria bacterium]